MTEPETPVVRLERRVDNMERTLFGEFGQGGIIRKFDEYFTWSKTRDEEKKIYEARIEHQQQQVLTEVREMRERKILWMAVITVICTVVLTILGVITYENTSHHTLLEHIMSQSQLERAAQQFDATVK